MFSTETEQPILIVTGMHRSGTSVTTSLLQSAGLDVGQKLLDENESNLKGHFENLDFLSFHENVLRSLGISPEGWTVQQDIIVPEYFINEAKQLIQKNASGSQPWGWKEPRTTLFLNFWDSLLPKGKFLFIYRSPWEVLDSLFRRGNDTFCYHPEFALKTWMDYNQKILDFYRHQPERCLLFNISQVTQNFSAVIEAIQQKLGIELHSPAADLYDPSLLQQSSPYSQRQMLIQNYFPEAFALYGQLNVTSGFIDRWEHDDGMVAQSSTTSTSWLLQDWLDLRHLERNSQHALKEVHQQQQSIQAQLEQQQVEYQNLLACSKELEQELEQVNHSLEEQLQRSQEEQLQRSQYTEQLKYRLEQVHAEFTAAHEQLEQQGQARVEKVRSRLAEKKEIIQRKNELLQQSYERIAAVESSKFWKLRSAWFRFKGIFGIREQSLSSLPTIRLEPTMPKIADQLLKAEPAATLPYNEGLAYELWMKRHTPTQHGLRDFAAMVRVFADKPLISIVMPVYNPPVEFLREAIASVMAQVYPYWELCIADDASPDPQIREILEEYAQADERIKVMFREKNGHISRSSNSALELATGEFVALLDHDDVLAPEALYEMVLMLNKHPEADMIYSDEDKIDENNQRKYPFFKPDWCPDSFLSRMYTCHLGVYRRSLITEIGGFRVGFEGSQDYDLVLRLTEKTNNIFHIPKVLYGWRLHEQSASCGTEAKPYAYEAARRAIAEALERRQEAGTVTQPPGYPAHYIVRYKISTYDLVSIIIPTRDLGRDLNQCLESIFGKSTYPNFEVIVIDNGSTEPYTEKVINTWLNQEPERFRCYTYGIPFNYSKLNNFGVTKAKGKYLLFLNNDTEVITPDWIEAMVEQAQRSAIGAVGVKLLYPDDTIQHAGVVIGLGGGAGHGHKGFSATDAGYHQMLLDINNYTAVTGACLMCRREVFDTVGGFNEEHLAIAFNDVDFCLKIVSAGFRNIWLPHAVLYHYESKSRGYEDTPEKVRRFGKELAYLQEHWKSFIERDPCYSVNLSLGYEDFRIREQDGQDIQLALELKQANAKVKRIRSRLEGTKNDLKVANNRIEAMQTSKFWKLRSRWLKVKRSLGMATQDSE